MVFIQTYPGRQKNGDDDLFYNSIVKPLFVLLKIHIPDCKLQEN